ncbi:uncharacterized protein [Oryza sativa Japonica Group]|uniref:Os03g0601500 protein n=10 Tax=Oryza TaxID=4527 RepID=Q0DQF2_ORYSJ|nr:uncharacterized protein LOC4333398 [Oryza sativa Japonica Group]XP_052150627.1 uncharacterized protein LOC127768992 [Oryza glaberrima]EEC75707.1 hypothetical protein OsI_12530 [Oryza sativa Indica Group]KAB8092578.1 hypothetical protein EE612_018796 [Oryza sativa]KAF2940152.1 hypothetical protein DAI22_03g249800 [Oryza sativa Japonica Group]BAF12536.2 Os03g0601500 [Oryza sativa Japonica Group]BAS85200.1 Os03g0601500 [Oryza sativa Japonica Group]|eukprot:NP_001050622.2 Os03g0601500 [Oryza sativa Japonica Group]
MGRWVRPEVYPLMAAMMLASGMVVFQLGRNVCTNPEVKISKRNRRNAVPDSAAEAERYSMHGFRRFFGRRRPEVMPSINRFFSNSDRPNHDENNDD